MPRRAETPDRGCPKLGPTPVGVRADRGSAYVLPGRPPSLTVTDPAGPGWMPWDDSWDERRPYPCAMCAFRAPTCGICAGRTPGTAEQPTFNPWGLESS